MRGRSRLLVAMAIVGFVATAAPAATIVQMEMIGPATPNFYQALTFDQYHGLLTELISVKVELGLNIAGGYLVVDNDGAFPAYVVVQLGAMGGITSTDVHLLDIASQPVVAPVGVLTSSTFNLAGDDGDGPMNVDPSLPDGATHLGGVGSNSGSGFINSTFFADYVGPGTFNINAPVVQILDFGAVGGVEGSYGPVAADGFVRVTYNFIPEPATAVLLGLGIIAAIRRRQ